MAADKTDRRRNPRVQILGNLHGRIVALDVPVTLTEISLGGMAIQTEIAFPVGAVHEFQLALGDDSLVHLKGRVAHCQRVAGDAERYLSGIQFLEDAPEEQSG
jgi:PilZ domain